MSAFKNKPGGLKLCLTFGLNNVKKHKTTKTVHVHISAVFPHNFLVAGMGYFSALLLVQSIVSRLIVVTVVNNINC